MVISSISNIECDKELKRMHYAISNNGITYQKGSVDDNGNVVFDIEDTIKFVIDEEQETMAV